MRLRSHGQRLESEPSTSINWEPRAAAPALTSLRMKQKRLTAGTRAHGFTVPCPSQPSAAALPCTALPPLASQAGGWSSWAPDGSRHPGKLLPLLQWGATSSWQQMEGPQQQRELHRQRMGREPACPWSGDSPGTAPSCHPAPITPFPSAPDAHPSLPPLLSQKAARCHSLCPARARKHHTGSPDPSELCPGHTVPVTHRPHHLGPNPNPCHPACRRASMLVPARGHEDRSLGHGNSHTPERPAPSKAGGHNALSPHSK